MPRVVVISDIHGNLPALQSIWADIEHRRFECVLFLGDLVAFGPQPAEALAFLRDIVKPNVALRGNTDRYIIQKVWEKKTSGHDKGTLDALKWTARQIGKDGLAYLKKLQDEQTYEVEDIKMYLCHGAPGDDERGLGYNIKDDVAQKLEQTNSSMLFCGHTHIPTRTRCGSGEVVNVGSVGFPFDGDVRACYTTFFAGDNTVQELHFPRIGYNHSRTRRALEASDMPLKNRMIHRLRTATLSEPTRNRDEAG